MATAENNKKLLASSAGGDTQAQSLLMNSPLELVVAVLAQLDAVALARARATCRAMRNVAGDESLWRRLYIQCYGPQDSPTPYASFAARFGDVKATEKRNRRRVTSAPLPSAPMTISWEKFDPAHWRCADRGARLTLQHGER
jgi:hypothetical protein